MHAEDARPVTPLPAARAAWPSVYLMTSPNKSATLHPQRRRRRQAPFSQPPSHVRHVTDSHVQVHVTTYCTCKYRT